MSIDANSNDVNRQPSQHSQRDERRSWMRFGREPGTDFATILRPDHLAGPVEVIDESLGGFGFVVDDPTELKVDQSLEVEYANTYYRGRVRHISRRPDGRLRVGVSCR